MAKINAGTTAAIQWIYAGSTISLLPNYTAFEFTQSATTVDTTSGAATWDTNNPSRRSWELSLDLYWDDAGTTGTGGTADLVKLTVGEVGLLAFGPQGTATGKAKYGGTVSVTDNATSFPFDNPAAVKLSFKGQGAPYWNHGSAWA